MAAALERLSSSASESELPAADIEAALPPEFEHRIHSDGGPLLTVSMLVVKIEASLEC